MNLRRSFLLAACALAGLATAWIVKPRSVESVQGDATGSDTRVELPPNFKQSERWLVRIADARAGEFADLLRRALDQAGENSDNIQTVLARWAELDPDGLIDFAVANGTLQISEGGRHYDFCNLLCDALIAIRGCF